MTDGRNSSQGQEVRHPLSLREMNSITFAGLILIYTSVAAFFTAAYFLYLGGNRTAALEYAPAGFAGGIGVFVALLGVKLVRAGGLAPSDPLPVVNQKEWDVLAVAITENKDDPIGQFIRLSSLTGATGWFTKLGLSGLPLATIGLTIFFALISLFGGDDEERFYQLTQITLGAFVGSFVQKQVGALRDTKPAIPQTEAEKVAAARQAAEAQQAADAKKAEDSQRAAEAEQARLTEEAEQVQRTAEAEAEQQPQQGERTQQAEQTDSGDQVDPGTSPGEPGGNQGRDSTGNPQK